MSQYNKTKGSQFETDVMKWLRGKGVTAERLSKAGAKDEGDIVTVIAGETYILELKNRQTLTLPEFWREAQVEALNYAKAIAMHGLGLQLWTGEDIPELTTSAPAPAAPKKAAPKKEQEDDGLIELNVGDANWEKVVKYIETNASLGIEKIGKQLVRKYRMTPDLKKTIVELINTHTK